MYLKSYDGQTKWMYSRGERKSLTAKEKACRGMKKPHGDIKNSHKERKSLKVKVKVSH